MLTDWPPFQALAKAFAEGQSRLSVAGLSGAARSLAVAELLLAHPRPALVVTAGLADAHRFARDLRFFGANAVEFPEAEPHLWRGGRHREADAERAVACRRLLAGEPLAVVATPAGLEVPLPALADFTDRILRLSVGDRLDRELLLEGLERAGYERTDTVVEVGQWSVRGGIVDVFSPAHPSPARLEFFGDDLESIRFFDPTSQRSTDAVDELALLPLPRTGGGDDDGARLFDVVPERAVVVVDDPDLLGATSEEAPERPRLSAAVGARPRIELVPVAGAGDEAGVVELAIDTRAVEGFGGRFTQLTARLVEWRTEGFRV